MRAFLLFSLLAIVTACSGRHPSSETERHYTLSGTVLAVDPKHQVATINAAAIPNFMEAMTMDYRIKSKAEFEQLHAGQRIKATVNVRDDGYDVSNIQLQK